MSIESKVRKLCITQGFTLGVKGLTGTDCHQKVYLKTSVFKKKKDSKNHPKRVTYSIMEVRVGALDIYGTSKNGLCNTSYIFDRLYFFQNILFLNVLNCG